MECADLGRYANAENLLSQHARFLLNKREAEEIVNDYDSESSKMVRRCAFLRCSERDAKAIREASVSGFLLLRIGSGNLPVPSGASKMMCSFLEPIFWCLMQHRVSEIRHPTTAAAEELTGEWLLVMEL